MKEIIYVHTGEAQVCGSHAVLRSTPLGSCVAVTAWSLRGRLGAMAHIMLPGRAPKTASRPTKYAHNAMEVLVEQMTPHASLNETGVCVIGAANVLNKNDDTICDSNIASINEFLSQRRIPVHAAALGGYRRRTACLYIHEGRVTFTQAEAREKTLWQHSDKPIRDKAMERISLYG